MTDIDASRVYWFNKLGKILTIIPTIPREKVGQSWSYYICTGRNIPLTPETPTAIVMVDKDDEDLLPIQVNGYTLEINFSLRLVRDILTIAYRQRQHPTQDELVQTLLHYYADDEFREFD